MLLQLFQKIVIEYLVFDMVNAVKKFYIAGCLDKRIPFDPGEEATKEIGVEIGFAKCKFDVCKVTVSGKLLAVQHVA